MSCLHSESEATGHFNAVLADEVRYVEQDGEYFKDNLEYLQALEVEAEMRLAAAYFRIKKLSEPTDMEDMPPLIEADGHHARGNLEDLLAEHEESHRKMVRNSLARGIQLNFETLCANYGLNEFERSVLLLFFISNTSLGFKDKIESSHIDHWHVSNDGLTVGTILSILCSGYRDQILKRKYFSIDSPLVKHEIIITNNIFSNPNILDAEMELHERITRYILGDNYRYNTDLMCISTEKANVQLDQVVLEPGLKQDTVQLAESYAIRGEKGAELSLDEFYGYGTGLSFLFHGPSGTGKTALAHALANHLNMPLLSLNVDGLDNYDLSFEDAIKYMFREARLSNCIVFLDECDDLLREDSHDSRTFLIEIEKSQCITIMATNKVVDLDPALDRRISMKVPFILPDEGPRTEIWKALVPPKVTIASDVDFREFAKKYVFTGGLIKNTIFMAINNTLKKNGKANVTVNSEMIHKAAAYQAQSMFAQNGMGEIYLPETEMEELGIKNQDRSKLMELGSVYHRLRRENLGLSCVLNVSDIQTGIDCVDAVAARCNARVRRFSLSDVTSEQCYNGNRIRDPFTQKEMTVLDYAFEVRTGYEIITLFIDHEGVFGDFSSFKDTQSQFQSRSKFLERLRTFQGMLFVVTTSPETFLPPEFACSLHINYPAEELQIRHWENILRDSDQDNNQILDLVERYPMHLREIDLVARQAKVAAMLDNQAGGLTLDEIYKAIRRIRKETAIPVLFGEKGT